jgi:hypothetical protein
MTLRALLHLGLPLLPALLPLAAAGLGAPGPREVALNFGPGDGPYTEGFAFPNPVTFDPYDIQDGVATHWTSHDARVELPLTVHAPALQLSLRFARHFADRGHVDLSLASRDVGRLEVGKGYQEYRVTTALPAEALLRLDLHVEARDDRNLGLSLDWLRITLPTGSRIRLTGMARWRPAATVAMIAVLLLVLGFAPGAAAALAALPALFAAFGLVKDPWLAHRLLTGLPETLLLFGGAAGLAVRWAIRKGVPAGDVRFVGGLVLATLLVRALLVNYPDFYYPDFMIHTRIAKLLARDGLGALLAPAAFCASFQEARNSVVGMPYSIAFHVPFALLDWPYDGTLSALKLTGAVLSVLPLALGFALARRLDLPARTAAVLLALAPTYPHWLFRATLPALLGHSMDLVLLLWLARNVSGDTSECSAAGRAKDGSKHSDVSETSSPRTLLTGAALLASVQLAYSFSIVVSGLLVVFLVTLALVGRKEGRVRPAVAILGLGLLGSALSLVLYYRDFVPGTLALLRTAGPGAPGPQVGFVGHLLEILGTGLFRFFDTLWPLLALLGLPLALARPSRAGRAVLLASLLTWSFLTLLRVAGPGVFRWNHDLLLLTPLLALLGAAFLARLHAGGGSRRVLAGLLLLAVAAQSLAFTRSSYTDLLGLVR